MSVSHRALNTAGLLILGAALCIGLYDIALDITDFGDGHEVWILILTSVGVALIVLARSKQQTK